MDLTELLRWRKFIPAAMFSAVIWPSGFTIIEFLAKQLGMDSSDDGKILSFFFTVVALPLGLIYHSLDFRQLLMKKFLNQFNTLIVLKLHAALSNSLAPDNVKAPTNANERKKWMRLYFKVVDGDSTLVELSRRIRDNGLALSSCCDAVIILGIGGFLIALLSGVAGKPYLLVWSILLMLFAAICWLLLPKISRNHSELIEDQLFHVTRSQRAVLVEGYKALIRENP